MNKYIDAEKLKELIDEKWKELADKNVKAGGGKWDAEISTYLSILRLIESFQQEQPKVDLVAELKHHLATTPKEQLEKEWKELEPWGNIGPTVQEFLYGKQPEVDLEKELEKWRHDHFKGKRDGAYNGEYLERESQLDLARHFVELGLNARKV